MFEKVNPGHPDKMADRLAGAVVDLVYERAGGLTKANPRVACEVMAGHGRVDVQIETSLGRQELRADDIVPLIHRVFGDSVEGGVLIAPQDIHLSENQTHGLRCGDNGIFRGVPPTHEQKLLTDVVADIYKVFPYDGKYTIHIPQGEKFAEITACQSHVFTDRDTEDLLVAAWGNNRNDDPIFNGIWNINPLGPWSGGIDVDCGCTNRKLGSDMGDGVTGGGLHGKDLSKGDVSINIVAFILAQRYGTQIETCCSIGDEQVTFNGYYCAEAFSKGLERLPITMPFSDVVEQARLYIHTLGGFEKFAEWGLVRPLAQV